MNINGKLLAEKAKRYGYNLQSIESKLLEFSIENKDVIELDMEQAEVLLNYFTAIELVQMMIVKASVKFSLFSVLGY